MLLLGLEDLKHSLGPRRLFDQASCFLHDGQGYALVGPNGSGKSTLLKILAQELQADEGRLSYAQNLKMLYVPQNPMLSQLENLSLQSFLQEHPQIFLYEVRKTQAKLLNEKTELSQWASMHEELKPLGLENSLNTLLKQLSGGQLRKAFLLKALSSQADLIILDEPTNHLDLNSIDWLTQTLSEKKATLLTTSHDRYFLDDVADIFLDIVDGEILPIEGGWYDLLQARSERASAQEAKRAKVKNEFVREAAWARKQPKARTTKQKFRLSKVNELATHLDQLKNTNRVPSFSLHPALRLGKSILEFEKLAFAYPPPPGESPKNLWQPFSYIFKNKERVLLWGPNGAGKSTFIQILLNQLSAQGKCLKGQNTQYLHVPQHIEVLLDPQKSVYDNMLYHLGEYINWQEGRIHLRSYLQHYLFKSDDQNKPAHLLSGGEKKRLAFAKIFSQAANFLLLDEPTNDLDVESLMALEQALLSYDGCIIFTSHDRHFMDIVPQTVFYFDPSVPMIHAYHGNYSYVKEKLAQASINIEAKNETGGATTGEDFAPKSTRKSGKNMTGNEKKELGEMPAKIQAFEEKLERLKLSLSDSEISRSYSKLMDLQAQIEQEEAKLLALYERWEFLEQKMS